LLNTTVYPCSEKEREIEDKEEMKDEGEDSFDYQARWCFQEADR
jgi:hypothetical protein